MSKRTDLTLISLRLTPDQVAALDNARRAAADIPDRTTMVRRILEAWLDANPGKAVHREDAESASAPQ